MASIKKSVASFCNRPKNKLEEKKVHFCIRRYSYIEPKRAGDRLTESSDLYYTQEEYTQMHMESNTTLQMMQRRMPVREGNGLCSRGLEDRTPHRSNQRIWNHSRALLAVMREQIIQKDNGISDAENISKVYQQFSTHCLRQAHNVGLQDAIDASKVPEEEKNSTRNDNKNKLLSRLQATVVLEVPLSPQLPSSPSPCKRMASSIFPQQTCVEVAQHL